jgi:hypothetical protein
MSAKKALHHQLIPASVQGRLPPFLQEMKMKPKDPTVGGQERNLGVRVGVERMDLFSHGFLDLDGIIHGESCHFNRGEPGRGSFSFRHLE